MKTDLRQRLQNLIDLKGQDIELIGEELLSDLDDLLQDHENEIDSLKDDLKRKEEECDEKDSRITELEETDDYDYEIKTGLDTIKIKMDNGNLLDTQVLEALGKAYDKGVKQVVMINILENLN